MFLKGISCFQKTICFLRFLKRFMVFKGILETLKALYFSAFLNFKTLESTSKPTKRSWSCVLIIVSSKVVK